MAIYYPKTFDITMSEEPLQPGVTLTSDGQALVGAVVDGAYGVAPSAGVAGEVFVGFLKAQTSAAPFVQTYKTKVEQVTLPANATYTLARTPIGGTLAVYDETTAAAIASANYTLTDATVVVTGKGGDVVTFTYEYDLSVAEARSIFGDVQPGGYIGQSTGQCGVMKAGVLYTDNFDTSVNWREATTIKTGADGKLVASGNGATLRAVVVSIPSSINPFLGIRFNTP